MKSYSVRPVTTLQFVLVISGFQVSVAFLSLPRDLARNAGTDGWIAILIGWAVATVAALVIARVMKYNPDGTILELTQRYMGKRAAQLAAILFWAYFLTLAYDGFITAGLIIKLWLLPSTYIYVITLLLLLPTFQIGQHGLQIIGRYAEMVALLSAWLPIIYIFTLRHARWLNLLPVLKEGWLPVLSSLRFMIFPMLGMVLAFFLYPHLEKKEKAASAIIWSNTASCTVYLAITIICFVYYSPDEMSDFNQPVISIMKSVEFKFMERVEVPFIAFYLFIFSCIWIPAMYICSYCTAWLTGKGTERGHLAVWCAVIFIAIFVYRPRYMDVDRLNGYFSWIGLAIEFALPVCLLVYLVVYSRVKGGNST